MNVCDTNVHIRGPSCSHEAGDGSQDAVLPTHRVNTQVIRLSCQDLYPLSHLAGLWPLAINAKFVFLLLLFLTFSTIHYKLRMPH